MPQGALAANVATIPNGAGGFSLAPMQMDKTGNLLTGAGSASVLNKTAGASVIKATAGRISKVIVNTAASTAGSVSDCATTGAAAAGNQVLIIPSGTAIGTVYNLDWPCLPGLVLSAVPSAGSPICAVRPSGRACS